MLFIESMRRRSAPFTYAFLSLNFLIFFLMEVAGGSQNAATLMAFGVKSNAAIDAGEIWRFLTPVFIHIGLLHLALNSYALWIVGQQVERLYGSARFVTLYVLMGMAGVGGSYLYHPEAMSAGASGAIFGLFGVLLVFGIRHRRRIPAFLGRSITTGILPVIAINLGIGFAVPAIDNAAHIGGLLAGMALASVLGFHVPGNRTSVIFRLVQIGLLSLLVLSFAAVEAHYDGPGLSVSNLYRSLRGRSPAGDFIDAVNTAQESFILSEQIRATASTEADRLDEVSDGLSSAVVLLEKAPPLSTESDALIRNLQEVLKRRRLVIEEMRTRSVRVPSQSMDDDAAEFRETMKHLREWVETDGARFGLQIRHDDTEGVQH